LASKTIDAKLGAAAVTIAVIIATNTVSRCRLKKAIFPLLSWA
jgi:hypothetical protein